MATAEERFLAKVDKQLDLLDQTQDRCWIWLGAKTKTGYGMFRDKPASAGGKAEPAHRWAYKHWIGPIPDGYTIDHKCRTTNCIKPEHLEAVTAQDNRYRQGYDMRREE